ncbi:unnamed protein product [Hyaloperonospora brassicae]|uniref:Uncharacterized protein n=1 Tax=Hyaloperonospora brassicae TaxID=162125 RepID=A0AAV0T3L8_HYABA|nr:unnamed protein product [Hyaloperonospora brassicae]
MEGSGSVQTLIDRFERLARANAAAPGPPSRTLLTWKKTVMPALRDSPVKRIIGRMNRQRSSALSTPVHTVAEKEEETAAPDKEPLDGEETAEHAEDRMDEEGTAELVRKPLQEEERARADLCKSVGCKDLTVEELDVDDTTPCSPYDTIKTSLFAMAPRSPSASSTASTGSLDSLFNSPDQLQSAGETSAEGCKPVRPAAVDCSRCSFRYDNRQPTTTSKLVPPTIYRRCMLTRKPSCTTTIVPAHKTPRQSSQSAQEVVASSSSIRTRIAPSSIPRYMDYDSAPRFAATKAWNMERRRQLEERNRTQAAKKVRLPAGSKPPPSTLHVNGPRMTDAGSMTAVRHSGTSVRTALSRSGSMPGRPNSAQPLGQLRRCKSIQCPYSSVL